MMTANRTLLNMKKTKKVLTRLLLLVTLAAGLSATPALAQEYKEAYNAGLEAYKAKNINEAYTQWDKAARLAKQAGDNEVADKASYYVAQLDYKRGLTSTQADKFEEALTHFEKGIAHYPTFAKNYLGKGLALKKLDRIEDAMAAFMKTREVAASGNDRETGGKAVDAIRDHFHYLASTALSRNGENATRGDATEALGHLEQLAQYDVEMTDDTYYYQAAAYNIMGDYAKAVEMADQAIEMHKGSKSDAARIWFVKGEALMYSGDTAGARAAFQNASFGSYKNLAQHYLDTLGQ